MSTVEERRTAIEIHMLGTIVAKRTILALESHPFLAEAGVSMLQFGVLRALRRQPRTISELSPLLMVDPSTLVSVVDALERKGLARRGSDPDDRRRVPISLTPEGAEIAASHPFKDPLAGSENPLLCCIDAMGTQRSRLLLTLLRELVSHLPDGAEVLEQVSTWVRLQWPTEPSLMENE